MLISLCYEKNIVVFVPILINGFHLEYFNMNVKAFEYSSDRIFHIEFNQEETGVGILNQQ